jgi:signal transduction histidine kinase/DNA-binding response OmpR family regulator
VYRWHLADRLSHVKTRFSVSLAALLSTAVLSAQPQNPANSSAAPAPGTALASPARSAEAGRPFIRRYTPREYGAGEQNWAFAQDDRGVIYVGNNLGVLEYDGASWRLVRVPNQSVVRSLAKDDHGRIYAGAVGEFGYLEPDAGGRTKFVSLLSHVPSEDRAFGDVWRTLLTPEGVYFQSQQYLFRWSNGGIRVWKPLSRFYRAGVAHGVLYIGQPETGLMRMVGDSLQEVPGGRQFVGEPRPVILPYEAGKILVGTDSDGLFLADGQSVTRFPTEIDGWLRANELYRGTELPDGTIALASGGGGVAILDRQGRLQQLFDASVGLPQQAYYVASDRQGALWLELDDGIARVETPSPISVFDRASGLTGSVSYIYRHLGTLYVATAKGVYYLASSGSTSRPGAPLRTTSAFVPVEGIGSNDQSWWFVSVDDPSGRTPPQLLAATSDGVYRIEGHKAVVIRQSVAGSFAASVVYRSKRNPNRVFVGLFDGLSSLRLDRGKWVFEGRVGGIGYEVRTIVEDGDGRLWLGTAANGVLRVTFWPPGSGAEGGALPLDPRVERFGEASGLPATGIAVVSVAGNPLFGSADAIFRFDQATSRFTPDNTFKVVSVDPTGYGAVLSEDARGDVWVNFGREWAVERRQPDGTYKVEKQPFLRFAGIQTVANYADADGVAWFSGRDGIVRYDPRVGKDYAGDFPALIRRVVVNGASVPPTAPAAGAAPGFKYDRNALRFEFAAPSFDDESSNSFQFYLEGLDKDWSDWDRETNRDYTHLPPGDYRFHARARNVYGHIGREAVYAFTILPPWYRTWAAYGLYLLLLGAVVGGVDRLQRQRLIRQERERARLSEAQLRADSAEALARAEGERTQNVELLSEIGKEITASLDFDTIFLRLYERVNQLADATVFGVGLYDAEKQQIDYRLAVESGKRYAPYTRDMADKNQFPVWCIENRKPVFINDVTAEYTRYLARYDDPRRPLEDGSMSKAPVSLIYLPLMGQGRVLGVITVQSFRKHAYTEYHLNLLQNLAAYTSIALDNANAYRQLNEQEREIRQRAAELVTIDTISRALASELELASLIPLVGDQVRQIFGAQIAYLALYDEATRMIDFPYGYGDEFPSRPLGVGMTSRIIQTGEPLLINEDLDSQAAKLNIKRSGLAAKSYVGVPIPVGGRVIGVLSVQSTEEEGRFTETDLRLLTTIAANVGVAIHNARLFEEARLARAAAEEADAAKSAFLSTVSHELRTPLTSVLGFAKIIRKRLEDRIFPLLTMDDARLHQTVQQISENLTVVVSEGERLTKLIDDVLDLAKIEAGKLEWHMDEVAVADIIDRATAATSSLFEHKGLPLLKDVAPGLPPVVGDADRLLQVVINLISNAVKFTEAGSVTCRARLQEDGIVVSVVDTGYGIATADQPKVFEKFKQVGDTLTDKPKGTGLGLPICREIVEHHGGRIWVESEPGKGSTFSFLLPARPQPVADRGPVALEVLVRQLREHAAAATPRAAGARPNVLAVDDDPNIRELLEQEFTEAGYRLRVATNGREAIAEVRRERPDLIILDVMMPELSGFDVAAMLKNDPETMDIPIIILSIVEDRTRGFRLGVDRYFTKPIDTAALFKEVGTLLEQGRSTKHVLVVDEDASAVKMLSEVLQARGYSVTDSDGTQLVAKALAARPDIVLLNAALSEKQELIQALRFEKGLENVLFLVYQ